MTKQKKPAPRKGRRSLTDEEIIAAAAEIGAQVAVERMYLLMRNGAFLLQRNWPNIETKAH